MYQSKLKCLHIIRSRYGPGSKPSTFLHSRCGWRMRRKTASNHEGGPPAGTYHRDLETTTSPSIRIHNLQENICTIVPKLPCSIRLSAAIKEPGQPSPSRETTATLAEGNYHNQDRQHLHNHHTLTMSNPLDTDAGSELFSSYEAELKLVQADLNQKLDQIPDLSGEPRKAAISQAERALEEASELVGSISLLSEGWY